RDLSALLSIPSSFCVSQRLPRRGELAFPRFAEGFSQMLFDGMHEGHEKRDGDRYPLFYSSDKHISSPALSIFTFPSGLSYHSGTQNNPPTKFDCLFRISSFIQLYRQGSKLNNLTKPFFPYCFTQTYILKGKKIYCSCVTEGNSIPEATQKHDEKEPFVITASFTEFH
ncbi:hypothetical protein ALC57_12361, partial [Trachymyrmex cornetzi]